MRITDLLRINGITLNAEVSSKEGVIDALVDLQEKSENLLDKAAYRKAIMDREAQGTTAVGNGIAVPHAKSEAVRRPGLSALTVSNGVDYGAPDGLPSKLFFMIAATQDGDAHLEILSRLMVMLMDGEFADALTEARSVHDFLALIDAKEAEKFPEEAKQETMSEAEGSFRVLAVTACPTGIAHTFMAAEALERAAADMGCSLKAETNGSGGVKNALTREEIDAADGIIIAADKNVDMGRFDGKRLIQARVADGIHKPEELIEKVITGKAPVYRHEGGAEAHEERAREGFGHGIYKHLMNGVSHMLPFVIGGGILIALAFLFDNPNINPENFGMNTPVAAFFKTVGGKAFDFMLPVLAGYIAMSIADRPGLAVGFVGGALAAAGVTFANPEGAVSAGFLGALIAGFAGGYLVLGLRKICGRFPRSLEGIKPVLIYPLLGILLIGVIMCLINPFVAMLNTAIANGLEAMGGVSKVLLGILLAGMMAADMGGPINKAAYVFGTAAIANGNLDIMAAVMIGGMIPPLAIALCATFFKNRFTDAERKSGIVNYIMGLCFITEGAIPFAAADPIRVLPSCIVGSAVAGGISMAFNCTLRAPHGGIFVFPVMGNVGGYIIALVAGAAVGMILLAILKKPIKEGNNG